MQETGFSELEEPALEDGLVSPGQGKGAEMLIKQ